MQPYSEIVVIHKGRGYLAGSAYIVMAVSVLAQGLGYLAGSAYIVMARISKFIQHSQL